jgi:hypothetical protein
VHHAREQFENGHIVIPHHVEPEPQRAGTSSGLAAGASRVSITPPVGIALVGFAGRPPSTGVHDDLSATALVLAERDAAGTVDAATRIALVSLDLLGLYGDALAPAIKAEVQRTTGIPGDRVLLCCSHTHYGPVMNGEWEGGDDPEAVAYRETLPHHIAGVVAAAGAALRPVTLAAGRGSVRVGINRREWRPGTEAPAPTGPPPAPAARPLGGRIVLGQNPEGTLDSEVLVWRFDAADGPDVDPGAPSGWVRRAPDPVAVVFNYACHPVSLGGQMRLISADFPGVACKVVERLVGGTALFLQGACGNVNPSLMGPDWDMPRRLGHALGAEAARAALLAAPIAGTPLRLARETVALPPLLTTSLEDGRRMVETLEAERRRLAEQGGGAGQRWWNERGLDRARRALAALEGGEPLPPLTADLAALRLGDAALAANPSELFCEIGLALKQASPFAWTSVAGYADGMVWYVPTRAAYAEGGYEVERACHVAPEAGELIQETGLRLLRALV